MKDLQLTTHHKKEGIFQNVSEKALKKPGRSQSKHDRELLALNVMSLKYFLGVLSGIH